MECTVDEAAAAGATAVLFNQPVLTYVENFMSFPVGSPIPVGFYDRIRGSWVGTNDGAVIKILAVTAGAADVDTDGDGVADNGLGITLAERQALASRYAPGQSVWRMPVSHFSPYDGNLPYAPDAPDATSPDVPEPKPEETDDDPCEKAGSIIACQNQSLGQRLSIVGTPFELRYQGERQKGRTAANQLTVQVSGATLPSTLKRIELSIAVAGQVLEQTFSPSPSQTFTFRWDGRDGYGRLVQGRQSAKVDLAYVYNGIYGRAGPFQSSFGTWGVGSFYAGLTPRLEVKLGVQGFPVLGPWDAQPTGLGGWNVNIHHAYDRGGKILHLGNGRKRSADSLQLRQALTVAGSNGTGFSGDGQPAVNARLNFPIKVAEAADGSLYILDVGNERIRRVDPNGVITTVAGNGGAGYGGDGGPATSAQFLDPWDVAVGPDGSLYIADTFNHRIRKVTPDGIVRTIAGTGTPGFSGDGGPALQARLDEPNGIALAPNGDLYIADSKNFRIRLLTTDGTIRTVAGNGQNPAGAGNAMNGMRAIDIAVGYTQRIAVGPDGGLYIGAWSQRRVYKVGLDGTITIVAGTGTFGYTGDGGAATAAQIGDLIDLFVAPDNSMYLALDAFMIRRVAPDGIITTVAKAEDFSVPVGKNRLSGIESVWMSRDRSFLYVADATAEQVVKIGPPLPGLASSDLVIAGEQSNELYVFDGEGRHLRTIDPLTGALRYQFAYTSTGLLASVTDVDGKITTIERDAGGLATAIVAPGGQRTGLTIEANGYLTAVTNPANETVIIGYSADGLMATLKDPRGNVHAFTHDALGRFTRDDDPATGFKTLTRTEQGSDWTIGVSSALNRTATYQTQHLSTGEKRLTTTDPAGLVTTSTTGILPISGNDGIEMQATPDGMLSTRVSAQDPRFGMQSPLLKSLSVRTPAGLTSTLTTSRAVTLSDPTNLLSLATQTDTLVINGRTYTSAYTQATRLITTTTPAGRQSTVTLDVKGRVVQEQVAGLEPVTYEYDSLGRLSSITQGTGGGARASILAYNTKNELIGLTDSLNRTVGFGYNPAGRIITQTLPDLRTIGYGYDGNGNVTAITPPGRPAHAFAYTPLDLESRYQPPAIGLPNHDTQYAYNLDRQLTLVTRPDGQTIQLGYDTGGRLGT